MEIVFYGATERVTGSCHIIRANGHTLLLDCGLVQGSREEEEQNEAPFPFDPSEIDALILSHGHIDHSGRIPLLCKRGFKGAVYTGEVTVELARILLLDSAELAERDAAFRRRHPTVRTDLHREPLYTRDDAEVALGRFQGLSYGTEHEILPGIVLEFRDAGHILGSAFIRLTISEGTAVRRLVFSGDLGQYDGLILHDPELAGDADAVIIESTYGDRLHRPLEGTVDELGSIIRSARRDAGNILIPAFAIGRSQELLYLFARHYEEWELDCWQIYLDSPMAIDAGKVYRRHPELFDAEARAFRHEFLEEPPLRHINFTPRVEQSMAINRHESGAIIIAGSGMCNGGRILHHLKRNLWRPECRVLITGFQAPGTLGRSLVEGAREVVIHGRSCRVAAPVHTIGGLSAHGDRDDMLRWAEGVGGNPQFFVVHGDQDVKQQFRKSLEERLKARVTIPESGACFRL